MSQQYAYESFANMGHDDQIFHWTHGFGHRDKSKPYSLPMPPALPAGFPYGAQGLTCPPSPSPVRHGGHGSHVMPENDKYLGGPINLWPQPIDERRQRQATLKMMQDVLMGPVPATQHLGAIDSAIIFGHLAQQGNGQTSNAQPVATPPAYAQADNALGLSQVCQYQQPTVTPGTSSPQTPQSPVNAGIGLELDGLGLGLDLKLNNGLENEPVAPQPLQSSGPSALASPQRRVWPARAANGDLIIPEGFPTFDHIDKDAVRKLAPRMVDEFRFVGSPEELIPALLRKTFHKEMTYIKRFMNSFVIFRQLTAATAEATFHEFLKSKHIDPVAVPTAIRNSEMSKYIGGAWEDMNAEDKAVWDRFYNTYVLQWKEVAALYNQLVPHGDDKEHKQIRKGTISPKTKTPKTPKRSSSKISSAKLPKVPKTPRTKRATKVSNAAHQSAGMVIDTELAQAPAMVAEGSGSVVARPQTPASNANAIDTAAWTTPQHQVVEMQPMISTGSSAFSAMVLTPEDSHVPVVEPLVNGGEPQLPDLSPEQVDELFALLGAPGGNIEQPPAAPHCSADVLLYTAEPELDFGLWLADGVLA